MAKFPINDRKELNEAEPEVWIEYQRVDLDNDNFARQSFADAIHRNDLMPNGTMVRTRRDDNTNETVWEYLM